MSDYSVTHIALHSLCTRLLHRRNAVLAFLSTLPVDELAHVLYMMVRSFIPKSILLNLINMQANGDSSARTADGQTARRRTEPTPEHRVYDFLAQLSSEWYNLVFTAGESLCVKDMVHVHNEVQIGFLHLLEQAVKSVGLGFSPHVALLTHLVYLMLSNTEACRGQLGDLVQENVNDLLDTEDEVEITDGGVDVIEKERIEVFEGNQMKNQGKNVNSRGHQTTKIRNLCILRLSELVEQYHAVFDFKSVATEWMKTLVPLLHSLPTSLSRLGRTPALLALITTCCSHDESLGIVVEDAVVIVTVIKCIACRTESSVSGNILAIISTLIEKTGGHAIAPHAEVIIKT